MLIQKKLLEQLINMASDSAEYLNEKWITVKPHGAESKGTHVLVKDGETSKQAVERKFGDGAKDKKESETREDKLKKYITEDDFKPLKQRNQYVLYKDNKYIKITPDEYKSLMPLHKSIKEKPKKDLEIKKFKEDGKEVWGLYRDNKLISKSDNYYSIVKESKNK